MSFHTNPILLSSVLEEEDYDMDLDSLSGQSADSNSYSSVVSTNTASTGVSRITLKQLESIDDESLATKESKALVKLRFFLITILFWSTVGVGLWIYIYFSEEIETKFEEQYYEESTEIFRGVENAFVVAHGAIDSFVLALCTQYSAWPFVTVPRFSVRAEKLRNLTSAVVVTNYHYVRKDQRRDWEAYSANNDAWVEDGIRHQQQYLGSHRSLENILRGESSAAIDWTRDNIGNASLGREDSFLPRWQQSPVSDTSPYNWDGFQHKPLADAWEVFQYEGGVVMGHVSNIPTIEDPDLNVEEANKFIGAFVGNNNTSSSSSNNNNTRHTEPFGDIFYPIMNDDIDEEESAQDGNNTPSKSNVVGVVAVTFYWRDMLKNILSDRIQGIRVVIENNCNQTFTYTWSDHELEYLGHGDHHEPDLEGLKQSFDLADSDMYSGLPLSTGGGCQYTIHTYASAELLSDFKKLEVSPGVLTAIAVVIFIFTSLVFLFYDCLVERRQRKVYSSAVKNNAIVSSLFPKSVRDRLYKENSTYPTSPHPEAKIRLRSFMHEEEDNESKNEADAPIADLFSNCTVLFADISGFTSWSSERSPSQVFVLLETIYGAFDRIADRRGVFKVETIGDCYMAVTGLPNPTRDHAVIMAKFARDCREQMNILTRSLEVSLGPETSDLVMRFGLHSGPVTAGVLRGQKSRFQLFGDTVNTAARMESTGIRNQIHVSEETARLLTEAGKTYWLTPRKERVQAKGKGELTTFWLFDKHRRIGSVATSTVVSSDWSVGSLGSTKVDPSKNEGDQTLAISDGRRRLIDWNVDLFAGLIRKVVARREAQKVVSNEDENVVKIGDEISFDTANNETVLDEVVEIITLPSFDPKLVALQEDPNSIQLGELVMEQLRYYIFTVSNNYKENPFHNFEHASHVTMSVAKLLSRIVAPDLEITFSGGDASTLHDHTYGITSDPLTQFACIFAALIHDVDHQGVPNTTLVKEGDSLATKYKSRSVAEQNSVDIAWALFLEPKFDLLRDTICPTHKDLNRLRQLVVNTVLATDIMDKDLKQLRNQRWEKAFSSDTMDNFESNQDKVNRKATIVLEHLIQASDVCHTMQHWHVYRKWNERLFEEMYLAYKTGRSNADPSTFWYKGELGFFDFYIIPLSKKLSDCGVFGVSSDEYLNYALRNRKEWEQRGEAIVAEMIERLQGAEDEEVC